MEQKKLIPPFSAASASEKLQLNEAAWNSKDPERVALLYTVDTEWRDRTIFLHGREEVKAYLTRKWKNELDYMVRKELWGAKENRNAVRFEEEWRDHTGQWFHGYSNEQLEFDEDGLIRKRFASTSEKAIEAGGRTLKPVTGR